MLAFDEYKVRLPLDSLFKSLDLGDVRPREMSWSKLSSITREEALKVDANYANKLEVERHKRWAYPVACIALTLFVLPLASLRGCTGRRGSCWPLPCSSCITA